MWLVYVSLFIGNHKAKMLSAFAKYKLEMFTFNICIAIWEVPTKNVHVVRDSPNSTQVYVFQSSAQNEKPFLLSTIEHPDEKLRSYAWKYFLLNSLAARL